MRITQTVLTSRALLAVQDALARVAKSQNRLATGRQLLDPADDPTAHAAATRLGARLAAITQYQRQATEARTRLEATGAMLSQLGDLAARVQELALTGSSGSQGANERAALATEVNQLLEETVSVAGTRDDGRYLLGGQNTQTPPLTVQRDTDGTIVAASWNPRGVDAPVELDVAPGVRVRVNAAGTSVLGQDSDPTFLPALLISLRDALRANDGAAIGALIDPLATATARLAASNAQIGGSLQLVDRAQTDLDGQQTAVEAALSALTDADIGRVAVELSQQEAVYQAALAAAAKALEPSLLEFLR
jgi:flagellar hook-associated protein 3 FlgL